MDILATIKREEIKTRKAVIQSGDLLCCLSKEA
jgi:hypothetical protein